MMRVVIAAEIPETLIESFIDRLREFNIEHTDCKFQLGYRGNATLRDLEQMLDNPTREL